MIFVNMPECRWAQRQRRHEAAELTTLRESFGPDIFRNARGVTGGVNPRIDGAGWTGEKRPSRRFGLFNGMAVQIDGLSVASSV
jgi:hypothetical protein